MKFKAIFISVLLMILSFSLASAEVPKMINYQGKLTTPKGKLVDGVFSMVFSIYDSSTGGTALWTETQDSVKVENGIFSVLLGSVEEIPDSVFDGDVRHFGVKVGDDSEMTPRKAILSVGYAYKSMRSDTASTADTANVAMYANDADMVDGIDGSDFVQTAGDQTIGGMKTFENIPVLPASDPTTDNQAVRKAYVDGIVSQTGGWRHSGAQVFSGTGPTDWTDLDLSSYVGSNYALVLIKVKGASGSSVNVFKPNGDADEYWRCSDLSDMGAQGHKGECAEAGLVLVETDANGIIEWKNRGRNVTLTLLGYVK